MSIERLEGLVSSEAGILIALSVGCGVVLVGNLVGRLVKKLARKDGGT